MCEPISLAFATAATGALGAVGSHQNQKAQVNAANSASIKNYNHQLQIRRSSQIRNTAQRQSGLLRYSGVLNENNLAATRAYSAAQGNLNSLFDEAAFNNQDQLVNLVSAGSLASSGVATGRSSDRVNNQSLAQFQRNQAIQAANLSNAVSHTDRTMDEIRRQKRLGDMNAWNQINVQPTDSLAPPTPQMQTGPSGLGLATGLLQAGLEGSRTYNELKVPNYNRESLGPNTPTRYLDGLNGGPDPLTQTPTEFNLFSDPSWGEI